MTYQKIFTDVRKAFLKADTKKLKRDFAFQFNITGSGEGIFYATYKNSVLDVQPYDYADNDCVFYAGGDVFIKIANGVLSFEKAVKDGFLRVEGNTELAKDVNKLALEKTAGGRTIKKDEIAKSLSEKANKKSGLSDEKTETTARKTRTRKSIGGEGYEIPDTLNFFDSANYTNYNSSDVDFHLR